MTDRRPVDLQGCQGDKKVNIFIDRGNKFLLYERKFHPPTQESTALAVEECMTAAASIAAMDLPCFGGFRRGADDPPEPWRLRSEAQLQRPGA